MGSLQHDSSAIYLHDIQQSVDETEPSVLERSVQPGSASLLTSFSWHPTHENRLLTIALTGNHKASIPPLLSEIIEINLCCLTTNSQFC